VDNGYTASKYVSLVEEIFGAYDSDDSEMSESDSEDCHISLAQFPSTVSLTASPSSTLVNVDDEDIEMADSMKA
jgi:hypothetical protein